MPNGTKGWLSREANVFARRRPVANKRELRDRNIERSRSSRAGGGNRKTEDIGFDFSRSPTPSLGPLDALKDDSYDE